MQVRFGIIGTNAITERMLTAARGCEGFRLTTVYSRNLETAQEFAQRWDAPFVTTSLEELAVSTQVDAVYIASPNSCHAPQALQLLRAGKHVLCEKPIARDSEQFAEMLSTAREYGVVLLEAMRSAHMPGLQAIRTNLDKIGPVRRVSLSYCQYSSRYDRFKKGIIENAFNPALCNGALMDIGVYCVHMMIMLFGAPQEICARAWYLPGSIDALGNVICCYDGMQVMLSYSKVHQSDAPAEIEGELGTLRFTSVSAPCALSIAYRDGRVEKQQIETEHADMCYELRSFMRMIRGEEQPEHLQLYSLEALRAMDEIRLQAGIDFAGM